MSQRKNGKAPLAARAGQTVMINRQALDFDQEHVCSVTLATTNVYACLSCGKFYKGTKYSLQLIM